jgi:hypothetical protein
MYIAIKRRNKYLRNEGHEGKATIKEGERRSQG